MTVWENEKSNLEDYIINKNMSYEEIGRLYGCTGTNIKKVAAKLNIPLPKKRSIGPNETFGKGVRKVPTKLCLNCGNEIEIGRDSKFCCNECGLSYKHNIKYKKIIDGDPSIMRANYSPSIFRDDILKEQGGVCAICKKVGDNWNGKPLTLRIDHIDGRSSNNRRDNLRCICPNCDSQLDTYKSKNKNSDRNPFRYGGYKRIKP